MALQPPDIRLTDRDRKILHHVKRYRMTTPEILHRAFFADKKPDAVISTLRRLCGKAPKYHYLRPETLFGKRKYYRLTALGADAIDENRDVAARLGIQARASRYAILWFMHELGTGARASFNPRDFPEQFDLKGQRLPRNSFYIEEASQELRMGFILVNLRSDPLRVARKCADLLTRFLRNGWFDEFFAERRFVMTVLTVTEGRKNAIREHLERAIQEVLAVPLARLDRRQSEESLLALNVVVVPDLLYLIPGQDSGNNC